jgi:hypothetical protein
MASGPHLTGKLEGQKEIISREEVLMLLSEIARKGSVSAAIHLERALRLGGDSDEIDDVVERILQDE